MPGTPPQRSIEFIGGPFDGHIEQVSSDYEQLPADLLCLVNENVFRLIGGQEPLPDRSFTSVAIYQRQPSNGRCVYLFIEALATQKIKQACDQVGIWFDAGRNDDSPSLGE